MKLLMPPDLNVEDSLMLSFEGLLAHAAPGEHELEPFLRALESHGGELLPDIARGKRRRKYSRAAIWKALEEQRDEYGSYVSLYRTSSPAVSLTPSLEHSRQPPELDINLYVQPLSFFAEPERCRKFVDMVRAWASHYPVTYTLAHSMADDQLSYSAEFSFDGQTVKKSEHEKIYEAYWLNIFGPQMVESVGRERMLSTPAHRVEELPGGAVLVVTWPTAADFASEEARQAQARALVHLRPDLDLNTVLRTLRKRSATLAPVEPHFHPEVAPLLSRMVDSVSISERQRKVAEFNAYQPPEPREWAPADSVLPPDVQDVELVRRYYATLAERLVALLHSKVPSVYEETPESLTDVDYRLWHERFPETFERHAIEEHAVPAVGAYLGEVLVRRLGGQWIPRKKLVEAQVLVGQRVWYPILRAYRALRSSQSLLDCSLTQLYRVAERHRY